MARDFFIEILPAISEDAPDIKAEKSNVTEKVEEEAVKVESVSMPEAVSEDMNEDAASNNIKRTELGFEVFGEEADEPEEAEEVTAEEPCNQDEVGEEEPVVYEDAGNDEVVQTIVEEDCITVTSRPMTEEEKAAEVLQPVAGDTPKYDKNGNGLLFDF